MFFDDAKPTEHVLLELGKPPTSDNLPGRMWCPAKHYAFRSIYQLHDIRIPFYVCESCLVVYRYQECTLPPGDEGHP